MVYLRYRQARHLAGLGTCCNCNFDRLSNRIFARLSFFTHRFQHRLNKGQSQYKQLPKEDTDYLVNGMYM